MTEKKVPTLDELAIERLRLAVIETQIVTARTQAVLTETAQLLELASKIDTPVIETR